MNLNVFEIDDLKRTDADEVSRYFAGLLLQELCRFDFDDRSCALKANLLPDPLRLTAFIVDEDCFGSDMDIEDFAMPVEITAASHCVGNVVAVATRFSEHDALELMDSELFRMEASHLALMQLDMGEPVEIDNVRRWLEGKLEIRQDKDAIYLHWRDHEKMTELLDRMYFLRNW